MVDLPVYGRQHANAPEKKKKTVTVTITATDGISRVNHTEVSQSPNARFGTINVR